MVITSLTLSIFGHNEPTFSRINVQRSAVIYVRNQIHDKNHISTLVSDGPERRVPRRRSTVHRGSCQLMKCINSLILLSDQFSSQKTYKTFIICFVVRTYRRCTMGRLFLGLKPRSLLHRSPSAGFGEPRSGAPHNVRFTDGA